MNRLIGLTAVGVMLLTLAVRSQTNHAEGSKRAMSARTVVVGPSGPINDAIAAGATAVVTLQPVPPKTVPASSYPPDSSIVGTTLTLGSVPARVWIEMHVTGWPPSPPAETLKTMQIRIDALDSDGDGNGYDGDLADCNGSPALGAGDITPAMQACGGTCSNNAAIGCASNFECRRCIGGANNELTCSDADDCPGGSCPPQTGITCIGATDACRLNLSGYPAAGTACNWGEPSRCLRWDGINPGGYYPPGYWCEFAFQDRCEPQWLAISGKSLQVCDLSSVNTRCGITFKPGEAATDFAPSYFGTLVLDVPADATGTYEIDMDASQTYLQNPQGASIPIAAWNNAAIKVVTCSTSADCNDDNVCTADACVDSCECTHTPIAGWDPETECCHPISGVQSPIPASSPCRVGGCSLGGSSGSPTFTELADGTACTPLDRCYLPGVCESGACDAQQYAGPDCLKSRFISLEPGSDTVSKAYRVRLLSLHHPDPPYRGGPVADFSAFEGEVRWIGAVQTYPESGTNLTPVHAALTTCQPHYQDWSAFDLVHVTGTEIVPSSIYEVQSIDEGLDINEESNFSAPVSVETGGWCDVVYPYSPPSTTIQPDSTDVSAIVDKFRSIPAAASKPRVLLTGSGGIPTLSVDVDFAQVSATNDAFRGFPYPYSGPQPCP